MSLSWQKNLPHDGLLVAGDTSVLDAQVDLRAELWNEQLEEGTDYKATLASSVAKVQKCNANSRKYIVRNVLLVSRSQLPHSVAPT